MINPLSFISKFIKSGNQRELDRIQKIVNKINSLEEEFLKLSDEDFPKKTLIFKEKIKNGQKLDQILPEAFALVREASKRSRNERHYDVQLIGGVVLHENKIAEMKTGEGKTLAIVLSGNRSSFLKLPSPSIKLFENSIKSIISSLERSLIDKRFLAIGRYYGLNFNVNS